MHEGPCDDTGDGPRADKQNDKRAEIDADLTQVLDAWPILPQPVMAATVGRRLSRAQKELQKRLDEFPRAMAMSKAMISGDLGTRCLGQPRDLVATRHGFYRARKALADLPDRETIVG